MPRRNTYPITNPGVYVQAVLFERISEGDRENIFYRNAEKLLEIDAGIEESSPGVPLEDILILC
ncbi:MAG: hypothetical protein NC121_05600 [Blautia sp.]|nr:hypothetical protein [Blautia sp.]